MRSLLLSIFPLFLIICATFFGCTSLTTDVVYPSSCYFEQSNPVVLIKDTPKNSTNVGLVIEGNDIDEVPEVVWDSSIIDYNVNTGIITAVGVGATSIQVSYKTSAYHVETRALSVQVCEPVYAQNIVLQDVYIMKNDQNATYALSPTINTESGEYNFFTEFSSSNHSVFTVDNEGVVIPMGIGEAVLTVRAVSDYDNQQNTYNYITDTAIIKVEPIITNATVQLYDSNINPLIAESGEYNLFYGTPQNADIATYYYAKISASGKSLQNITITAKTEGVDNVTLSNAQLIWTTDLSDYCNALVFYNSDYTEIFVPLRAINCGSGELSFLLNDDTACNKEYSLSTNVINIYSYSYISEQNFSVKTCSTIYEDLSNYATVDEDSLIAINTNTTTGKLTLYALGGNSDDKALGQSEGNYYYALIIFDNLDDYCHNNFTISNNSSVITLTKITDYLYHIQAETVGITEVNICANDGGECSTKLYFEVQEVKPESYNLYSEEDITFILGKDESINLAVYNIVPSYVTYTYELEIAPTDECPIKLAEDGSTISAIAVGNCLVEVTFNGAIYSYKVCVQSSGFYIGDLTTLNYNIEQDGGLNLYYEVLDANGKLATSQIVEVVILNGTTIVDTSDVIEISDIESNSIYIEWLKSGVVQLQLVLMQDDEQIDASEIITITCL